MIQTLIAMLMISGYACGKIFIHVFLLLVYVFCLVTMRSDDHVDVRDIIFQMNFPIRDGIQKKHKKPADRLCACAWIRESEMRFCIFQHDLHQFLAVAMGAFAFRNQNTSDAHS